MSDPDPETIDTGEPVEVLQALSVTPRAGFVQRIRASIQRRDLSSHFADFSWKAVTAVFLEYLSLAFGLLGGSDRTERGSE